MAVSLVLPVTLTTGRCGKLTQGPGACYRRNGYEVIPVYPSQSRDTVYETMFMKGNKDQGLLEASKKAGGKDGQQATEKKQKGKDGKKAKRNFDDELQAPNETDE